MIDYFNGDPVPLTVFSDPDVKPSLKSLPGLSDFDVLAVSFEVRYPRMD